MKLIDRSASRRHFKKVLHTKKDNFFYKSQNPQDRKNSSSSPSRGSPSVSRSKNEKKPVYKKFSLPPDDYEFAPFQKKAERQLHPMFRFQSQKKIHCCSPNVSKKSGECASIKETAQSLKKASRRIKRSRDEEEVIKQLGKQINKYERKYKGVVKSIKQQKQLLHQKRKTMQLQNLMFQTIIHNLEFQINQQQEGHMKDVGRTKKLSSLSTSDSDKFSDYGFNHS